MTTISIDHLFNAQFGEDQILWQVFQRRTRGYFIEVGAYNGVSLSNTFFLEQVGWRGLLVEPIPELAQQAAAARPNSTVINAACSRRGSSGTAEFTVTNNVPVLSFLKADREHINRCIREGAQLQQINVPLTSLDEMLLAQRKDAQSSNGAWVARKGWCIDLVSIDTEGCELDVFDGFELDRFKPRILLVENDRDSGAAIEPYLNNRGYRKFHRQKINDFYARTDDPADDLTLGDFVIPE